jgi:hypothetical protein
VLEYHPQGLFEKTGNLWRAQGRRVRLELKHFQRQVMTDTILHADDVDGWRGEIRDGEVVSDDSKSDDKPTDRPKRRPRKAPARSKSGEAKPTRARARTQSRSTSGQRRSPARKATRS